MKKDERSPELERFIAGITRRRDEEESQETGASAASIVGGVENFSGNMIVFMNAGQGNAPSTPNASLATIEGDVFILGAAVDKLSALGIGTVKGNVYLCGGASPGALTAILNKTRPDT